MRLLRWRLDRCLNCSTLMIKNPPFSSSHVYKPWIYFVVNLNGANPKLVPFRPAGRLISPPLLLSVILNILLSLAMHIVGFILVQKQPWYNMEYHRYQCGIKSSFLQSDFCQTSSGSYEGESNVSSPTKVVNSLKSFGGNYQPSFVFVFFLLHNLACVA